MSYRIIAHLVGTAVFIVRHSTFPGNIGGQVFLEPTKKSLVYPSLFHQTRFRFWVINVRIRKTRNPQPLVQVRIIFRDGNFDKLDVGKLLRQSTKATFNRFAGTTPRGIEAHTDDAIILIRNLSFVLMNIRDLLKALFARRSNCRGCTPQKV